MRRSRPTDFETRSVARGGERASPTVPELLLGNFELRRERGRGGFATVYEAFDRALNRPVAIKLLDIHQAEDETLYQDYLARFEREQRVQARLDAHPNVVRIHLAGEEAGRRFVVLEFVDGPNLAEWAREALPSEVQIADIGAQVAAALAHAHARGIVHRDVKPQNVIVDAGRRHAKLGDFGVAQVPAESQRSYATRRPHPGSPPYMSPEQEAGQAYLDARSDIYSLGCTLYEFATGVVYKTERRPLRALRHDLSPALAQVIERSLAHDPSVRYSRAELLAADLKRIAGSRRAILLPRPRAARGLVRPAAIAAVLVFGAATVAGFVGQFGVPPPATVPASPAPASPVGGFAPPSETPTPAPTPTPPRSPATPPPSPTASPTPTPTPIPTASPALGVPAPASASTPAPTPAPFTVTFVRQLPLQLGLPGYIPGYYPYAFKIAGIDPYQFAQEQWQSSMLFPKDAKPSAAKAPDYNFVVNMSTYAPGGEYSLVLQLPDGRRAIAFFHHVPPR